MHQHPAVLGLSLAVSFALLTACDSKQELGASELGANAGTGSQDDPAPIREPSASEGMSGTDVEGTFTPDPDDSGSDPNPGPAPDNDDTEAPEPGEDSSTDGGMPMSTDGGDTSPPDASTMRECNTPGDCDDGVACTADSCHPNGMCIHDPAACECVAAEDCDDSTPCTVDACDANGACTHDQSACECLVDADCDDGDDTTLDACELTTGTCSAHEVTYQDDVQTVFMAKCGPCHQGEAPCAGALCIATSLQPLMVPSASCEGKSLAECIEIRIGNGTMPPPKRGCTGDPILDADKEKCLTAEEHMIIRTWMAAGMPE